MPLGAGVQGQARAERTAASARTVAVKDESAHPVHQRALGLVGCAARCARHGSTFG